MTKEYVKVIRDNLKLSQEELAIRMGVSRSVVTAWENGKKNINRANSEKLEQLNGKEVDVTSLVSVRASLGLSQTEIASLFGVSVATIHRWEVQDVDLSQQQKLMLGIIYETQKRQLKGGENDINK